MAKTKRELLEDVADESAPTFDHGSNLAVGTSAEVLTATSFDCQKGVVVKAAAANTGIIYVGNSDVTAGSAAATDGFPLSAGDSVEVETDNPNLIFVIASVDAEDVFWLAV